MKFLLHVQGIVFLMLLMISACSSYEELLLMQPIDGDAPEKDSELDLSQYEAQEYEFYENEKNENDIQELGEDDIDKMDIDKYDSDRLDVDRVEVDEEDKDQIDRDCNKCSGVGATRCFEHQALGCVQWDCVDGCKVLSKYTQSDEFGYCSGKDQKLCNSCKQENYKAWGDTCTPPDIGVPWDFTATSSIFQKDSDYLYLLHENKIHLYSISDSTNGKRTDKKPIKMFQMPENTWNFVVDSSRLMALSKTHLHFYFLDGNQVLKLINSLELKKILPTCCEQGCFGPNGFSVRKGILYLPVSFSYAYSYEIRHTAWLYGIDITEPNLPNLINQTSYDSGEYDEFPIERTHIVIKDSLMVQYEHVYNDVDDLNSQQWYVVSFDDNRKKPVDGTYFTGSSPCCYGYKSDIRIWDTMAMVIWYAISDGLCTYEDRYAVIVELINLSDSNNPERISMFDFEYGNNYTYTLFQYFDSQFLYHSITGAVMKEEAQAKLCYTEFATKDSLTPQKCVAINSSVTSTKAISYILDGDDYYVVWDDLTINKYDLKVLLK